MAEEITTVESAVVEPQVAPQDVNARLQSAAWGETPTQTTQTQQVQPTTDVKPIDAPQVAAPTIEEEIFDENDYVKNKYGYDNADALINEINSLKEKSSKTFEWKNDNSKKIAELVNEGKYEDLYDYLHTQKQLEKLTTADLNNNKNLAAELVKFGIKTENKDSHLSDEEVEFLFNERYRFPEKPVQALEELDGDYENRVNAWQNQVNNIEKRLVIEAKMQQPKMAQLKSELVFPQIQKEQPLSNKPSQKDLEVYKERENAFIQSAQHSLENFKGLSYNVKDKDVDYTVNYAPSEEGVNLIASKMQEFINSGMNANALLAQRWVNADNTINTDLMVRDLSLLFEGDKILQKFANDSASKRVEAFLKDKKQVNVNGNQPQGTFVPSNAQSKFDKIREQAFA